MANRKQTNAATRTVTDEIGRSVTVPTEPQRIVSLAPNITEILFALGLGDRVVGVTSYCNYPAETEQIAKVGDTLRPNFEQIIKLKPDLVLITTASQLEQMSSRLTEAGIPLYVVKSPSIEATFHSIELIGQITNHQTQAEKLLSSLRARLAEITNRVAKLPRPKVFFVVGSEPLITAGRDAFITDLINLAGGQSISADAASEWPAYSVETVIARAPEIIIFPGPQQHGNESSDLPALPDALQITPAVRNKQVYQVNGDLILRPGPRIIDGLAELAKLFHPEAK